MTQVATPVTTVNNNEELTSALLAAHELFGPYGGSSHRSLFEPPLHPFRSLGGPLRDCPSVGGADELDNAVPIAAQMPRDTPG